MRNERIPRLSACAVECRFAADCADSIGQAGSKENTPSLRDTPLQEGNMFRLWRVSVHKLSGGKL